jgi:ferritin-like metal-binding protein YciE
MNLFSSLEFNSFQDLFLDQIGDLYDAEKRLTKALPLMAEAAKAPELRRSFEQHLIETEGQVQRLEQIFRMLGREPKRETCEAMKGLIKEGDEIVKATGDPDVKDAALIAAAQRVEHYEISGYGTARTFALHLGHEEAAQLLEQTLREEKKTDQLLTEIAERSVNVRAEA